MSDKEFLKPNPLKQIFNSHSFTNGEMYRHLRDKKHTEYQQFLNNVMLNRTLHAKNVIHKDGYYTVIDDNHVEYKINSAGLRSKNFDQIKSSPVIVGIGCSITHGTGLTPEETWIHKLATELRCDYVNLSMPGCSTAITSVYCTEYILKQFSNVKAVCVYVPPPNRVDLLCYSDLNEAQYNLTDQEVVTDNLLNMIDRDYTTNPPKPEDNTIIRGIEHTAFLNYTKDDLLLKYACESHDVPYVSIDSELFQVTLFDGLDPEQRMIYENNKARDGKHDGDLLHTDISREFLRELNELI